MAGPVKRVCLLGAESTGKTTLAGRSRRSTTRSGTPSSAAPIPRSDAIPTRRGRATSSPTSRGSSAGTRTRLARSAREVLFCDTDAFTTALFHQVYLGEPTHAFDDLLERRYDLYFVCGLEVPWKHDGIREFEEQRLWMHERYLERAAASGSPWVLVEGPQAARLQESSSARGSAAGRTVSPASSVRAPAFPTRSVRTIPPLQDHAKRAENNASGRHRA